MESKEGRKESLAGDEKSFKVFDIDLVFNSLDKYNHDSNDLALDAYLTAYQELRRFFELLGPVFSFVAKDVENKLEILKGYRNDEQIRHHYNSVQSMIDYETSNNLLKESQRPSGCRTFLRLHRALEFIALFMVELSKIENSSGTGSVAKECYKKSLSKYHPWYIQKTASLAMYTLPTRQDLITRAFGSVPNQECLNQLSADMHKLGQQAEQSYGLTQKLYDERGLLSLP